MNGEMGTEPCDPAMARWLQSLVSRSRRRAGRAQFAHDLAADYAEWLFRRQQGRCAISGLLFSLTAFPDVLVKHPFAPSLDRISAHDGYTASNVRLVCIAVNFGMGQWGEELYLTFARAAVERSNQAIRLVSEVTEAGLADAKLDKAGETEAAATWLSEQRERIAAAEAIAATLSGESLVRQRRRIASLKRNLTLGPTGLRAVAVRAAQTRNR